MKDLLPIPIQIVCGVIVVFVPAIVILLNDIAYALNILAGR